MNITPQCFDCIHFHEGKNFTCDAFTEGIPDKILFNEFDHTRPFEGDHGIQFEPIKVGKGSSTSGNYEHGGRPGEVGGSTSSGSNSYEIELSLLDKDRISAWSGNDYGLISRVDTGEFTNPEDVKTRNDLYDTIDKLPSESCVAYRGTRMSSIKLNSIQNGDIIEISHISSYTKDVEVARKFATGEKVNQDGISVILEASFKSAKDISKYSNEPSEKEVVVTRGTKMKVASKYGYYIILEEV